MSISFYDASVGSYRQVLDAVQNIMDKGATFAAENGTDLQQIVDTRLCDDMMPFHFQIVSVCHHSRGALQGMREGHFSTPSFKLDKSYEELQTMVSEAAEGVASFSESAAEAIADKSLVFTVGEREMPFTNQNFLLTFSLPNFYFHAATAYDILRMAGTPLGKRDFLGQMKIG
jgi:hypothetical protein